jgi:hypothetical protein
MAKAQLVLRVTLMQPKGMSRRATVQHVSDVLAGASTHIPAEWQHADAVGVKLIETHEWLEGQR